MPTPGAAWFTVGQLKPYVIILFHSVVCDLSSKCKLHVNMATRASRLLCSKTFLLSLLTLLGILELGRKIFENKVTEEIVRYTIVHDVANAAAFKLANDIATKKTANTPEPVAMVVPERSIDTPVVVKKTFVRHNILLLAYARYFSNLNMMENNL